jgi:hypothetical protein
MKIKKLLRIKLVAPTYLIVAEDGNNRTIRLSDTSMYAIGDMYEEGKDDVRDVVVPSKKLEKGTGSQKRAQVSDDSKDVDEM